MPVRIFEVPEGFMAQGGSVSDPDAVCLTSGVAAIAASVAGERDEDTAAPGDAAAVGPFTVLLAEDDPNVRNIVRHVLEADGLRVALATDGREALEQWAALKPDLLVLDVMMPHLTGLEVLARVRAGSGPAARVPVLVLSARASEGDIVAGFELGVSDYVTKPFMVGELRARVRSLLGRA
jgi:CheY-like chemotaxis protein